MPFRVPAIDEDTSLHYDFDDLASSSDDEEEIGDDVVQNELVYKEKARLFDRQARAADRLSVRLLEVDGSAEDEDRVLRESLQLSQNQFPSTAGGPGPSPTLSRREMLSITTTRKAKRRVYMMLSMALVAILVLTLLVVLGIRYVGPPSQPIGPYQLVERQEGMEFFEYYNFYEGHDSVGSNGYLTYVSQDRAVELGILNVTLEPDTTQDVYYDNVTTTITSSSSSSNNATTTNTTQTTEATAGATAEAPPPVEPFVYMGSAPTKEGPRESIRLEGKRRFHRGLFIIDLRHMPAGCGVWPAFWLTDEANWPVNGEIDIVEGVNYQSTAKTALHSTKGCNMDDVPVGVRTGDWDTAIGIPDRKTGIPDMTMRYATNCFVYDPHQWLNQGCVAVDIEGGTLGQPVNAKGGGVYALEWDPINRHMRTWVFTPHTRVPENLRKSIMTASNPDESQRVMPDPDEWPLPYGYFAIGEGTDCDADHFKNMRLVFNLAFCGSVSGNRFQLDCPKQAKTFKTCNDWVKSDPDELKEAYWKVRGVYVYEREWQKAWATH